MAGLLDYSAGTTILHRLHPLAKVFLALGICVAAFLCKNLIVLVCLLAFAISLGLIGGIYRKTAKLVLGLLGIAVFLFILQVLFIRSGTPVLLFITDNGLMTASFVVLRLMTATIPLALLLVLTQLNDLSNSLVKILHLPYRYAFTITTALRFIPVFTDEMSLIMESQTARGVNFDTKNPVRKIRLMIPLCVPLLVTSVGRIEQAAMAAEIRGFYLRTRSSGSKDYAFRPLDATVVAVVAALILVAVLL
ncbi:MAG TPA: energy-coupling factor transporter transmembrane protein EcfT [Coriobacteriia bacterium]|nr:energy-coupling factor transporter transmembrane protein EcfT [Coriobacteriia bacterium]